MRFVCEGAGGSAPVDLPIEFSTIAPHVMGRLRGASMNGPFRAAVICDGVFARREYPLLVRLEVGLADEGVRVAHAAPVQVLLDGVFGLYSEPVGYDDFAPRPLRGVRARNLNDGITHALKADSPAEIDVMHCCGGGAWEIAAEAATRAGAALLVEVWRAGMEQLPSFAKRRP